jgi:phosphohistidine swiveling domain-containing protein
MRTLTGSLVLDFARIDATMLAEVGGKAANLGELTRAGLPVPGGFCVTTTAYEQATAGATGLDEVLDALARPGADVPDLAARARAALLDAPVPAAVAAAVMDAYAQLGADTPVAVRSSATAEDLPFASFAGQQDTYLNVVGHDAVLDAVSRCWASLWTDRAVVYRSTNGIDHRAVRLAVVIQRMVDAQVAGVLFTANPVTGRRREAVVDANPGLGEAVVSGAVNPDHFVVDTATGEIRTRRLGDKKLAIRSVPGGGTTHETAVDGAAAACLTDRQVRDLVALGARTEDHFGAPQDTEWAIDAAGTLWLTQARPITTLYPLPTPRSPGKRVYFNFSVAQGVYRPVTPMGMAAFRLISSGVGTLLGLPVGDPLDGPPQFVEAGERVFVDVTNVLRSRVGRAFMPRLLDVMEARSAAVLRSLFDDPDLSLTVHTPWPTVRRMAPIAKRFRMPQRAVSAVRDPAAYHRYLDDLLADLHRRLDLPADAPATARLDLAQRVLSREVFTVLPTVAPAGLAGFALIGFAGKVLGDRARPGDLQTVLRGLPHNVTTEMDLALWDVATAIRADTDAAAALLARPADDLAAAYHAGTLPPVAQRALRDFLDRYGFRAVAEIDLGVPRWSDDPRHILGILANYLRLDDPALAPDGMFAAGARDAEQMIDTLAGRAGGRRGAVVRYALERGRLLAGIREYPKFFLVAALSGVRRHLAVVGAELAAAGRIATADDVFFLDLAEARRALVGEDFHAVVAERRETYDRELRRRHIPRVMLSDGSEPERTATAVTAAPDGALTGTAASAGAVTGVARVVLEPTGAHLEPGEILVAPSTDPGWTPLFLTAGGLVMEMGGANSHGAVVAREYGIPAVVGVPDATTRIETGDTITVDGTTGAVTLA